MRGSSGAVLPVAAAAAADVSRGRGFGGGSVVGLRRLLGDGGADADADLRRADAGARGGGSGSDAGHRGDHGGGRHRRRRRGAEDAGVRAGGVSRGSREARQCASQRFVPIPLLAPLREERGICINPPPLHHVMAGGTGEEKRIRGPRTHQNESFELWYPALRASSGQLLKHLPRESQ